MSDSGDEKSPWTFRGVTLTRPEGDSQAGLWIRVDSRIGFHPVKETFLPASMVEALLNGEDRSV